MSLNWKQKVLLVKTEATYGTDAAPSGAANAILAQDVQLKPMEGTDVSRDLERPYFGADATIPTELMSEITFDVELAPSGVAGTPPAWGSLLRACGLAETINAGTSVIYNPITQAPESATAHLHIDATRYVILGARGNVRLDLQAQAVPKLRFTFKGLFVKPTDAAYPTADLTPWTVPQVVTMGNTPVFQIDGVDLVMRSFQMDLGNQIEGRFLVGREEVKLGDRQESIETTVEAVQLATFDPFQRALDQSATALQLTHGTGAGKIATLDVPAAQMQRPQGLSTAQNVKEWPLRLVPLPQAGNDQFTLTLT
ncbi:phage tail tube protein [Salipiger sp.]|uniref:phage tail tube protein n=1 Tax=Salipiger sp. TaxID=2078585 RepID=UPI003A96EB10